MILPTKGIAPDRALITVGADVLRLLAEPKTVSRTWEEYARASTLDPRITFDWFLLSLDLLFMIGAIHLDRGRLHRTVVEGSEP